MAIRFLLLVALIAALSFGHGSNSAFAQAASEFAPLPTRPAKPKLVHPTPPAPPKVEAPVTPPPTIAAEPKPAEPTPPTTPVVAPPSVPVPAAPKAEEAHERKVTPVETVAEKKTEQKKKAEEKKAAEKKAANEKRAEEKKKAGEKRADEKKKAEEKKKKAEEKAEREPKPEKVEMKNEAKLPADDHGPRAIDFISKCLDNYDKCIAYVRELGEKIPESDVCMQNASDQAEITEKVRKYITLRPAIYQQAANRMVTEALYTIYPCRRAAGKKK